MSYREYVPTCVETLFGRPPTKFKARAIIPESKTFNLDSGNCKCCEKYDSQKKTPHFQEDFSGNDFKYDCVMDCPDCRKQIAKKSSAMTYNEGTRFENRRVEHAPCDCYCTSQYDCTDEEYYPEERNRRRHKRTKNKVSYSQPSRSNDSPAHSDSDRFCNVCHLWIRTDCKEKRGEYSSKKYEDEECIEERMKTKRAPCCKGYHFVVESCKICGGRRDGTDDPTRKEEENSQALQRVVRSSEFGNNVEHSSRNPDFFENKQVTEPVIGSADKERLSCQEIFEMFAEEIAALERFPESPIEEDIVEPNRQEDVLETRKEQKTPNREFKKAHSASAISSIGKRYKNTNRNSEDEQAGQYIEKSPHNSGFRNCNCEYARRDWKPEIQKKPERDKSEIRLLKKKCDEALGQLEVFKKEIAESKKKKCHCDMEFTMCVIEECKNRCAELEKQVVHLQRCIDDNTRTITRGNWEIRQHKQVNEKHKKQEYKERSNSAKRNQGRELMTKSIKASKKPRSTVSPERVRKITCTHIKCFPPEQVPDIPSFRDCPGYAENFQKKSKKR